MITTNIPALVTEQQLLAARTSLARVMVVAGSYALDTPMDDDHYHASISAFCEAIAAITRYIDDLETAQ